MAREIELDTRTFIEAEEVWMNLCWFPFVAGMKHYVSHYVYHKYTVLTNHNGAFKIFVLRTLIDTFLNGFTMSTSRLY